MNISQLLEALKDPSVNLTVGEKLLAGFSVTILSMVVVFIVLILISTIISLLQREKNNQPTQSIKSEDDLRDESLSSDYENDEELVSVITASIAAATGNSTNNILVKKIVRTNNCKTSWENMAKSANK